MQINEKNFESLERQTEIAFSELKNAIETRNVIDAVWALNLYGNVMVSMVTASSLSPSLEWNRGTKRADLFDRYMLQYAIGHAAASRLVRRITPELKQHLTLPEDEYHKQLALVKKVIDTKKGTKYKVVFEMAGDISERGAFRLIIGAMDYVREPYRRR